MAALTSTVDTDGVTGDYASLNAANTGLAQDLTDGGGDTMEITCQATDDDIDSTAVTITGWTTGAGNTIAVASGASDRASSAGISATEYLLELDAGSTSVILVDESYVTIDGLQIHHTAVGNSGHGIRLASAITNCEISNCYISQNDAGTSILINDASVTVDIWNCVCFNPATSGASEGIYIAVANTVNIYNCTVYGSDDGIERDAGTVTVINCAVFNNLDDFDGTMTIDHCASDDNDGTNNVAGNEADATWSTDFADAANGDFTLLTGSPLKGGGIDDPGSGLFDDDINGDTRTSTWDIGADEYIAPGGGSPGAILLMDHFNGGFLNG